MLTMTVLLYNLIWKNEYAPRRWRGGVAEKYEIKEVDG